MKKMKLFIIFSILTFNLIFGQENIPKISGTVKISVNNGTIEGDITLSDYSIIDNYLIRLNNGLNILNIESLEPDKFIIGYEREFADSLQTDETISYYFPASENGQRFLPSKLRFRYVGKFPVIKDTIKENQQRIDWRGNIAFKNGLLRLEGLQTAWYPTLYDVNNDFQFEISKYDIEIICEDCKHIYMNGSKPVKGSKARFISDTPREPYIFVGNYNVQNAENITVLNGELSKNQIKEFDKINSDIIKFLSNYLKIPFKDKIYWVQAYNSSYLSGNFSFASYPTFTVCGSTPPNHDLNSKIKNVNENLSSMIPHELSHYYFGTFKNCNNDLEVILDEGFAQFLAFKYLAQFEDEEYIQHAMLDGLEWFEDPDLVFKAILDFNSPKDTNDRQFYAYEYQTAILFSIEKVIGEDKMKNWIQLLLNGDEPISDKTFFKNSLKIAIGNDMEYNEVVNNYLTGDCTVKNMKKLWSE